MRTTTRARSFLVAVGLRLGAVAAAQSPTLSIELAHNSPNEQRAKDQLDRLLKEYDLSRWIFTKKIRIEQFVQPHSHPVLTGLGYHWIYQKVLDDQEQLSGLIRQHKLTLPSMP